MTRVRKGQTVPRTIRSRKRNSRGGRKATTQTHARGRWQEACPAAGLAKANTFEIPRNVSEAELDVGGGKVHLTNLEKIFWPELGLTKRDLLQYYADVSPWLLPHLKDRAMVMKRYPNGIHGPFFFMK